jgi:hypothetical protein
MKGRTRRVLTLRVRGLRPGRIGVSELNQITAAAQSAVNRQAEALEGRQDTRHPGPPVAKVHSECALELVSLTKGSTVLGFDFAAPQQTLPTIGARGLIAVNEVGQSIQRVARGQWDEVDAGVLKSLDDLTAPFTGRIVSIDWVAPSVGGGELRRPRVVATLTKRTREQIVGHLAPSQTRPVSREGVLEMADFKPDEFKCRLRPTLEPAVVCTFDAAQSNEIQAALRHPVRIEGTATIDSTTERVEIIRVERITALDSLDLDAGSFFAHPTFDALVRQQAIKPLRSLAQLAGGLPDSLDVDDMLADIYDQRS